MGKEREKGETTTMRGAHSLVKKFGQSWSRTMYSVFLKSSFKYSFFWQNYERLSVAKKSMRFSRIYWY